MANSLPMRKLINQLKASTETSPTLLLKLEDITSQLESESSLPQTFQLNLFTIPKEYNDELVEALNCAGYTLMPSGIVIKNS